MRILIDAGCFTDKHHVGIGTAHAEDGLGSRAGKMRTFRADRHAGVERAQHVDLADVDLADA